MCLTHFNPIGLRDPFHMITTGGEGHFFKKNQNIGYWQNGVFVSDYNFNGQGKSKPGLSPSFV